mmetsp:Transcript_25538/g.45017  ORF Transcript_25538/g.45017 Transcript_25538/m.45017 type:complete len:232 (+) Transcript_25538:2316-3011(+)
MTQILNPSTTLAQIASNSAYTSCCSISVDKIPSNSKVSGSAPLKLGEALSGQGLPSLRSISTSLEAIVIVELEPESSVEEEECGLQYTLTAPLKSCNSSSSLRRLALSIANLERSRSTSTSSVGNSPEKLSKGSNGSFAVLPFAEALRATAISCAFFFRSLSKASATAYRCTSAAAALVCQCPACSSALSSCFFHVSAFFFSASSRSSATRAFAMASADFFCATAAASAAL